MRASLAKPPADPPSAPAAFDMPAAATPEPYAIIRHLLDACEAATTPQAVLGHVLDAACAIAGTQQAMAGMVEFDSGNLRNVLVRGIDGMRSGNTLRAGECLGGQVLAAGRSVQAAYRDLPAPREAVLLRQRVVGVPIFWNSRLRAYFGLVLPSPQPLPDPTMSLLELLARLAGIAVDRSHYRADARRHRRRFELIARITSGLHTQTEPDLALQRTADAIHEVLRFPHVGIALVDPADPGVLSIRYYGGTCASALGGVEDIDGSRSLMAAALRERRTQIANDVYGDPRSLAPASAAPMMAGLAMPICVGANVIGVLNVESTRPFDPLDRISLEVVADCLALTIRSERAADQAHALAIASERQRLARELHDNVTQILTSISLLTQTLTGAWQRDADEGQRRVARLHQLAQTAYAEMRMLLRQLAPPDTPAYPALSVRGRAFAGLEQLREHALPGALTRLVRAMLPETLGLRMNFGAYVAQRLGSEELLYRVGQEALSNVIRHAFATQVTIEAAASASDVVLRIIDDGKGLDAEFRPGVGLSSMRARVEDAGGTFRVWPNLPCGTVIEARLARSDRDVGANDLAAQPRGSDGN